MDFAPALDTAVPMLDDVDGDEAPFFYEEL